MSTGSGGGFNFKVASAYVDLYVNDRTAAGFAKANAAMAAWAKRAGSMGGMGNPWGAATTGMQKARKAALSLASAFKDAADQEAMIGRLARSAEFKGPNKSKQLGALAQSIRKTSTQQGGRSTADLFKIADIGARQGFQGKELELFVRDMNKVATVMDEAVIPFEKLATQSSRLLSVFHRGNDEAIRLASAVNRLDMDSSASADEILNVTSRLSGMAAAMGMSVTQAMSLATALRQANVPLETGGTAMSQLLAQMSRTDTRGGFARIAGKSGREWKKMISTDAMGALKSFMGGVVRLEKEKGPIGLVDALARIHLEGQRTRGTILQLAQVMDKLDAFEKAAAEDWADMTSINKGWTVVAGQMNAQWQRMLNNVHDTAAQVGLALSPAFHLVTDSVSEFLGKLGEFVESNKEAIKGWTKSMVSGVGYLSVMVSSWESFQDAVELVWLNIKEKGQQAMAVISRLQLTIGENLTEGFKNAGTVARNVFSEIGRFVANVFSQIFDQLEARMANFVDSLPVPMGGTGGRGQVPVPEMKTDKVRVKVPGVDGPGLEQPGHFFAPGFANQGVNKLPGLGGLVQGLPDLGAQKAPIRDRLDKKVAEAKAAKQAELDKLDAEDEDVRAQAERKRLENDRGLLEKMRMRVSLMRTGKARRQAAMKFQFDAAALGFKGADLDVMTRAQALAKQRRDKIGARMDRRLGIPFNGPGGIVNNRIGLEKMRQNRAVQAELAVKGHWAAVGGIPGPLRGLIPKGDTPAMKAAKAMRDKARGFTDKDEAWFQKQKAANPEAFEGVKNFGQLDRAQKQRMAEDRADRAKQDWQGNDFRHRKGWGPAPGPKPMNGDELRASISGDEQRSAVGISDKAVAARKAAAANARRFRNPGAMNAARAQLHQIQAAARPRQGRDESKQVGVAMADAIMKDGKLGQFADALIRQLQSLSTYGGPIR